MKNWNTGRVWVLWKHFNPDTGYTSIPGAGSSLSLRWISLLRLVWQQLVHHVISGKYKNVCGETGMMLLDVFRYSSEYTHGTTSHGQERPWRFIMSPRCHPTRTQRLLSGVPQRSGCTITLKTHLRWNCVTYTQTNPGKPEHCGIWPVSICTDKHMESKHERAW